MTDTIAHYACFYGLIDVVHLLLVENSDMFALRDGNGRTPLYYASYNGHTKIVRLLVNLDNRLAKQRIGFNITSEVDCVDGLCNECTARNECIDKTPLLKFVGELQSFSLIRTGLIKVNLKSIPF